MPDPYAPLVPRTPPNRSGQLPRVTGYGPSQRRFFTARVAGLRSFRRAAPAGHKIPWMRLVWPLLLAAGGCSAAAKPSPVEGKTEAVGELEQTRANDCPYALSWWPVHEDETTIAYDARGTARDPLPLRRSDCARRVAANRCILFVVWREHAEPRSPSTFRQVREHTRDRHV